MRPVHLRRVGRRVLRGLGLRLLVGLRPLALARFTALARLAVLARVPGPLARPAFALAVGFLVPAYLRARRAAALVK